MGNFASFTRMDESNAEQWERIKDLSHAGQARVPLQILKMLSKLGAIEDGFSVNQLTHCLQTATRAERAGADPEMVVGSLCHDIGKVISIPNHPEIAASILRPYLRHEVIGVVGAHQDFQGRHYYHYFGGDPRARDKYTGQPWFELAEQFADDWDQVSFDPHYSTESLEHFEELVQSTFARPRYS